VFPKIYRSKISGISPNITFCFPIRPDFKNPKKTCVKGLIDQIVGRKLLVNDVLSDALDEGPKELVFGLNLLQIGVGEGVEALGEVQIGVHFVFSEHVEND
jgi:hypothetical protein